MRKSLLWALALVLLLTPARAAGAAGEPIGLVQYQERLRQVIAQLEAANQAVSPGAPSATAALAAARTLAGSTWTVETPGGPVTADLRPLAALIERASVTGVGGQALADALSLARQHLAAAEEAGRAPPLDSADARRRLESALKTIRGKQRVTDAVMDWLRRLWSGSPLRAAVSPEAVPYWQWGALIVGAAGVAVLARGLVRTLSGNAAGGDRTLRDPRARSRNRPATPEELRAEALELAAAGHFQEALRTAHLALVQHFDRVGLLRYVPSQTLREHERSLRRNRPDLARSMRTLNDLVEVRLYAGTNATAEDFNRAAAWVEELWREGDAVSKGAEATPGASSSASSP